MLQDVPAEQLPRLRDPGRRTELTSQVVPVEPFTLLSPQLLELARQLEVPLQAVLLAGHLKALSTISGYSRAVSCIVHDGPPEGTGGERALLPFLNCSPLAADLGEGSWRDLIRAVAATIAVSSTHRGYPLPRLQRELGRLFCEVLFDDTHAHEAEQTSATRIEDPRMRAEPAHGGLGCGRGFVLLVNVSRESGTGRLNLRLIYDRQVLDGELIERLGRHHLAAYEWMLLGLERAHGECSLLSAEERHRVLEDFNATQVDYGPEKLMHEPFEEQVRRNPDSTAVFYEGRRLSYRELNESSNQLAHYLRERGVGPDRLVGVCMERSVEMVVALLGILKAGGAYVPLDPSYPEERLHYMLQDTDPVLALTQDSLQRCLPLDARRVLALDVGWGELSGRPCRDLPASSLGLSPDHLAYVIYTSGSTGRPKGVMNEHRGLFNRLQWMQREYALDESDRVLQKTPFSFDVSVWEFFWPLQQGACLVMARPGGHRDPQYLAELIRDAGITTVHFVPSMLQNFLECPDVKECSSLRRVVCSGEELPLGTSRDCLAKLPWAGLYNLYGPTEAAIDVTAWDCSRPDVLTRVPIGRPISNTWIYILDARGEPVPIGVAGEIHIGGVGVARGYLNRQELTRERFVSDRFSGDGQGRLYRSGDLGRWRADGNIEYLGRNDDQVKVRGCRIETGEIEQQLRQVDGVSAAVVSVREDEPGRKRLVAYVVPHGGASEPAAPAECTAELIERCRRELRLRLPDYMLPGAFVPLARLPLTSNGKVDKRALPAPGRPAGGTAGG